MMQVVTIDEVLERLEDYVDRGGMGKTPEDNRPRGWLLDDIRQLCMEYRELAAQPKPKRRMSWREAWGLFDRRKN